MLRHNPHDQFITLDNFEGTVDLLLHLVQTEEIDIYEVPLYKVILQYAGFLQEECDLDKGAEFVSVSTTLLWLKSKMLLPQHEQVVDQIESEEEDPKFNIIHQLVDYCRFRDVAANFSRLEADQNHFFQRGSEGIDPAKKNLGIEHVSLEDFAQLFQQLLKKTASRKGVITEEKWRVSDKVKWVRELLGQQERVAFRALFEEGSSREEWIVAFLAILEMMKLGELVIIHDRSHGTAGLHMDSDNACGIFFQKP
jgi:segregation and condensation protein A